MTIQELLKDAYKDGMTLEEIEQALLGIEMPVDNTAELDRLREVVSKSNAEASAYKKQLREKMTADEIKAKEDAEKMEKLQNDYNALLRESNISKNKAKLLALGYDDKLAEETAEAMVDGNLDKVFSNQKKYIDSVEKKIRENVLRETPKPEGGSASNPVTLEQLRAMSPTERYQFSVDHPDEYKKIYGGNN